MPTFKIQNESCHQSNHSSSTPHNNLETLFDTSRTDEGILIVHVDGKTYNLQLHTTPDGETQDTTQEEGTPQTRVIFKCENISFFQEFRYDEFKNYILGLIDLQEFSNDVIVTFNGYSLILNEIVIDIQNGSPLQEILEFVLDPDEFTTPINMYLNDIGKTGLIVFDDITSTKTITSFTYTTDNQAGLALITFDREPTITFSLTGIMTVSVQYPTVNDIKSLVNLPSTSTQVVIELDGGEAPP